MLESVYPPLIEAVPNFSEGRNPAAIAAIVEAADGVAGARVLHVDVGYDANRTVVTLAGQPGSVVEACFRATQAALKHIDMRQHQGAHPRLGAVDVCPLVPIRGIDLAGTAAYAAALAERMGKALQLPVYLYATNARTATRANLAHIRQGEYENLPEKMRDPAWEPDFGPRVFQPKAGATVVGARPFLVAYNVDLASTDLALAKQIAAAVRESGSRRRSTPGTHSPEPGRCPGVKAIGWFLPAYGACQVSMNITDLDRTAVHTAFLACQEEAQARGIAVTGSELIGLAPLRVFTEAAAFFQPQLPLEPWTDAASTAVIQALGLATRAPFNWEERILEFQLQKKFKEALER